MNIIVGTHVWVEDHEAAWTDGQVTKINGQEAEIHTADGKKVSCFKYDCSLFILIWSISR